MCAASALCRLLRCHPSLMSAVAGRPDLMQQVCMASSHTSLSVIPILKVRDAPATLCQLKRDALCCSDCCGFGSGCAACS